MRMRTVDVALLSGAVLVVAGSVFVGLRYSQPAVAAEPVVMSAAEERDYRLWQETQSCIRAGHAAARPAGMTEEKFCEAYAMVQAVCRSQGQARRRLPL
jgi:hypothetical protein